MKSLLNHTYVVVIKPLPIVLDADLLKVSH